ncbi:MAG TPA: hypothetical protein VLR94_02795, partial [Acidobacteriota bacterium]|nr:hypothetical protein [Acidobacteriota bacterium]
MSCIKNQFRTKRILALAAAALAVALAFGCKGGGGPAKELAGGRRLYLSYGCGACHGMEGHGDGPAA